MKISIIIPVYNVERYISACLDSLVKQDLAKEEYEVLIINDGSTDGSANIAEAYCRDHSNIYMFSQKNGGVGRARNKGLELAKGDFVYFLDPDDYLAANILGKLLTTAIDNELDVLTFNSIKFLDSNSKETLNKSNGNDNEISLSTISTGIDYVANTKYNNCIWWFLINRKLLIDLNLNFIEGRWMEDAIFTIQLFIKVNRIAHLEIYAHHYRVSEGSAMTSKEPSHYLKVIRDNKNAAFVFNPIVKELERNKVNPNCIKRIKARQQSFVFFSIIRMIKSNISFNEVKQTINEMTDKKVYPLDSFLGEDYNTLSYHILARLINSKFLFYCFFLLLNPFFKIRYKF